MSSQADPDHVTTPESSDAERRGNLRAFLSACRSRLQPKDVDLPRHGHRRVPGLRREEVAELVGVSSDWYRWFESGRSIRVSPQFVARLGRVLHLDAFELRTLYQLSLPELYDIDIALQPPLPGRPVLSPIASPAEIEPVARDVFSARERFLSGVAVPAHIRPRIANSWVRSRAIGADPLRMTVPAITLKDELVRFRSANTALLSAAAPVLAGLASLALDSGFAVVMADARGCIIDMRGERDVLRRLSSIDFEPGGDLSEAACGTNAIGTTITDGRPLQLMGAENFCEGGSNLSCTAAPIRDPSTHEIIGALDVTADYRRIHPDLVSLVVQSAVEIEERLAASRTRA